MDLGICLYLDMRNITYIRLLYASWKTSHHTFKHILFYSCLTK